MTGAEGLGAFAAAVRLLKPRGDAAVGAIAASLGVEWERATSESKKSSGGAAVEPTKPATVVHAPAGSIAVGAPPIQQPRSKPHAAREAPVLRRVGGARLRGPSWLEHVRSVDAGPAGPALARLPLLDPVRARGVAVTALSRMEPWGCVDLPRVIDSIVRCDPLLEVPREQVRTLAPGAQIWLDRSRAMMPFATDQRELVRVVHNVLDPSRCDVVWFEGCPTRGVGTIGELAERPFEEFLPAPGRAVMLVTDLGSTCPRGGSGTLVEWRVFLDRLDHAGGRPLALVPHRVSRIPTELRRRVPSVTWWPAVSATRIAQRLREARR